MPSHKLDRRSTNYSSTEEESSCGNSSQEEGQDIHELNSLQSVSGGGYSCQMLPQFASEQHFGGKVMGSHSFLSLEKDLYSEEEWMKF